MGESDLNRVCAHCGLPVERAGDGAVRYCCIGCRLAAAAGGGGAGGGLLEARLVLSAFLAMGVMTFSLVLYGETLHGGATDPSAQAVRSLGRLFLAAFSLPVLALLGPPLAAGAWEDLRLRRVRMDGLIVVAVAAAYGLSLWSTWHGTGEVYFDTATMVLVLVTFGRRLEAHARTHGRDAAELLAACLPETAHLAEGGDVDPATLRPGTRVRIAPGEAFPADVRVVHGSSEVVCAHLTGEEVPRDVASGDEVPAGALNGRGALSAEVVRPAAEGALGRIRDLLSAPIPPTRWTRAADRLAGWLAAAAVVLAVAGGARSWWFQGAGEGLTTALSVLLVACPCALGLATPLAYRAVRAALARRGVLVRDPVALERAACVDVALLDKTGTLTDPVHARIVAAAGEPASLRRMAALVGHSGHPLARAVVFEGPAPDDLRSHPGAGVEGTFDGVACRAGSPEWMDLSGLPWDEDARSRRQQLADDGATLVAYAESGRVLALGALTQGLRPGAEAAVARLSADGLDVEVLSGDHPRAAARTADSLGIRATGGLSPEGKLARLEQLRHEGRTVLFAGDGVNDAPALRAADVGVALSCGTAAARAQAGVEILGDDLRALPAFLDGARALRRVVRGNLAWTVAYNAVALGAAAAGMLHPLVAVAAMIVSSLVVSVRSYRLLELGQETAR